MRSISLQIQPLPTHLLLVPSGDAVLQMPILDLPPKSTVFSTFLSTNLLALVRRLLCLSNHTRYKFGDGGQPTTSWQAAQDDGASASSLAPAAPSTEPGRARQPHPSPQCFCPHFLRWHLCQNWWALMQILLLIASMDLESGAVGVHIDCPLLGSADTNM